MNVDLTWHQNRAAESRRAIMRAAETLFLRDGYKCSVDAIAAEAGVARRTLYLQFGSKEALFRAIVDELSSELIATLEKILDEPGPVAERLTLFATRLAQLVFEPRSVAFLRLCISEAQRFPDLGRRHYETGMSRITMALSRYLAARMADGAVKPGSADLMAEQFLASVVGYRQYRSLLGVANPDIPAADYVTRAVAVFIASST